MLVAVSCLAAGLAGCQQRIPVARQRVPSAAAVIRQGIDEVRSGRSPRIDTGSAVVGDSDLALLAGVDQLRELIIDTSELTGEGLASLKGLQQLEHIRIGGGDIGDAGLQVLGSLPNLRRVNLPRGVFTDQGLAALASIPELELLRFGSPYVTDRGLQYVGRMRKLRFLHILETPVTDAGLAELARIGTLESLYLDGTQVTDQGILSLLQSLPDLHLHVNQEHHEQDPQGLDHVH